MDLSARRLGGLFPALTIAAFLVPVAVGLAGTLAPAFGMLPAIGAKALSLDPWRALFAWPGFGTALRLTLTVGIVSSLAALLLAVAVAALGFEKRWFGVLQSLLTPILAAPHAALALGLAFLLAPSGWVVRLISPELTGWTRPPAGLVTLRDPYGLALIGGLLVKEVPYLIVMIAAALGQVPARTLLRSARAMGYGAATAFAKLVLPRLWPQIRLPFYAVTAYSFSVVDQALVLAPGNPPPLAVLAMRWFADYDIAMYLPAAAAAMLQAAIVIAAIGALWAAERGLAGLLRRWVERGGRRGLAEIALPAASFLATAAFAAGLLALFGLLLWSFAAAWPFPRAWPTAFGVESWVAGWPALSASVATTLAVAGLSTLIAILLCIGCLEHEASSGRPAGQGALWLLYLPLLVPQIAFLFGVQVALVRIGLDGTLMAVVWVHLVFVLPYVFLSLADPWRALDPRYARSAASLGASPLKILLKVKLPVLKRPILVAAAVGVAVSVGQYLPTVFAGAGRVATITTEALTLATGADRRGLSVYGLLQALIPLAVYGVAIGVPLVLHRQRRGLA